MLAPEIIRHKRDGGKLSREELTFMANGIATGAVSEAQVAAFAMAIFFQGMSVDESAAWTHAMRDSGEIIRWRKDEFDGPILDKHSTGGVGDKVSLVLAPMLATCGAIVPMISGRGLGHTGGTLDKLESIPGFNSQLDHGQFKAVLKKSGCAIVGANQSLAPADRRLYAVRDVTATVESIPLITASILSKKMAAGLEGLILDVKTGSGAFAGTTTMARALATSLVNVGHASGLPTRALITDMNQVLGTSAGNSVEVIEAINYLVEGNGEQRFDRVVLELGMELLIMGGIAVDRVDAESMLRQVLSSGAAAERFAQMAAAQGAPADILDRYKTCLPRAKVERPVVAQSPGVIRSMDVRRIGLIVVTMGGGRRVATDSVNPAVGLTDIVGIGESVAKDQVLAVVHADNAEQAELASRELLAALEIGETAVAPDLIIDRIEPD
jgi:thymidine phosphorylase